MLPTPDVMRATRRSAFIAALIASTVAVGLALLLVPSALTPLGAGLLGLVWVVAPWGWLWFALRRWRRREAVAAKGLDADDLDLLHQHVAFYRRLPVEQKARFAQMVAVFLSEVPIHGVGCELERRDRLLVAASAVIPVFGFPAWEYDGLQQVLVRPESFDATFSAGREEAMAACGMVADGGLFSGTVILSRPDLRTGFTIDHDAHNVGIHEFAHLVDKASGQIDGLPAGMSRAVALPWVELVRGSLHAKAGKRLLRAYGYTNAAEFFAVGSELFFEDPEKMKRQQPELYALMERIYRQRMVGRRTRTRLVRVEDLVAGQSSEEEGSRQN